MDLGVRPPVPLPRGTPAWSSPRLLQGSTQCWLDCVCSAVSRRCLTLVSPSSWKVDRNSPSPPGWHSDARSQGSEGSLLAGQAGQGSPTQPGPGHSRSLAALVLGSLSPQCLVNPQPPTRSSSQLRGGPRPRSKSHCSSTSISGFVLNIYFERESDRKIQRDPPSAGSLPRWPPWPGWSQELGILPQSPPWVAVAQALGPSCFPRWLEGAGRDVWPQARAPAPVGSVCGAVLCQHTCG